MPWWQSPRWGHKTPFLPIYQNYCLREIVPETAKIFPAGQTVKAGTSACGDLDGKPRRPFVSAISVTINLCTMLVKRLLAPWGRPDAGHPQLPLQTLKELQLDAGVMLSGCPAETDMSCPFFFAFTMRLEPFENRPPSCRQRLPVPDGLPEAEPPFLLPAGVCCNLRWKCLISVDSRGSLISDTKLRYGIFPFSKMRRVRRAGLAYPWDFHRKIHPRCASVIFQKIFGIGMSAFVTLYQKLS